MYLATMKSCLLGLKREVGGEQGGRREKGEERKGRGGGEEGERWGEAMWRKLYNEPAFYKSIIRALVTYAIAVKVLYMYFLKTNIYK